MSGPWVEKYRPQKLEDIVGQKQIITRPIRLSSREAELLSIMMMNKGKAVTTSDIFDRIWKDDEKKDDDIVWVYISYIRQKLVSVNADIEVAGEKGGPYTLAEITGDDR